MMVIAAPVALLMVTICLAEAVPNDVLPKVKLAGVNDKPLTIVRLKAWLALGIVPLAACMVKLYVPEAVGVPLITPAGLKLRPGGNVPMVRLHVIVGLPVATSAVL